MAIEGFKCGYCGKIYTHQPPIEMCSGRDNKLPHAMGHLYKPCTKEEAEAYFKKVKP